jgi:hypothetical protein
MPYTPAFCYEVVVLPPDPDSGASIARVTSAAAISHNIYCEQPYSSPDGQYVAIVRSADFNRDFPWCDLLVAHLSGARIALAQRRVHCQIVNTAWGEHVFYWKPDGKLYRLALATLDETLALDCDNLPPVNCGLSISPDERYLAYGTAIPGDDAATFGIVRVDLRTGEWRLIFEHQEMVNPHTQFEPATGQTLLLQLNIEPRIRADGAVLHLGKGAVLVMVDRDGNDLRRLPVGPPHTSPCTGHQAFIPGTGRVALTVSGHEDLPAIGGGQGRGNLLTVGPGDERPSVFDAPQYTFSHVSISRCGRFFLADAYGRPGEPVPLIIGCLTTGKHRPILRDSHGTHGPCQWGHPHAYLTADNRHVIYNSAQQGMGQVYAAYIPDGFLDSLLE